jgi:hypothetical protein
VAPFAIAAEPFGRILGSSEDISEEFSEEWKYREPPDFFSGVFHPRAFMMAYPFYATHCPNHSVHQMYAAKRFAFSTQLIANSLYPPDGYSRSGNFRHVRFMTPIGLGSSRRVLPLTDQDDLDVIFDFY